MNLNLICIIGIRPAAPETVGRTGEKRLFFMSSGLLVRPLATEQIAQAYPLLSVCDPALTLEQWTSYAGGLLNGGNGDGRRILTVQNPENHIYGLSVYCLRPDLWRGSVLEIDNFAVLDIVRGRTTAGVLLQALEELGRECGCSCLSIQLINPKMRRWLRGPDGPSKDLFSTAGFRSGQLRLRKCF
jgi:GNAT superfamily N-acetyltransferase